VTTRLVEPVETTQSRWSQDHQFPLVDNVILAA